MSITLTTLSTDSKREIADLSPEVLDVCFSHAIGPKTMIPDEESSYRRRLVTLSHVSSAWRSQLLNTPLLWTDILIQGASDLEFAFFQRSYPLPVNLQVKMTTRTSLTISNFLCEKFAAEPEHLDRLRSLRLTGDTLENVHTITLWLRQHTHKFPILQSLDITIAPRKAMEAEDHKSHRTLPLQINSLTTVYYVLVCPSCHIPGYATLTTLKLHRRLVLRRRGPGATVPIILQDVLSTCPRLTTLIVGKLNESVDDISFNDERLTLPPTIKHLAILASPFPGSRQSNRISRRFRLPRDDLGARNIFSRIISRGALESLEITGPSWNTLTEVFPAIVERATHSESLPPLIIILNLSRCPTARSRHSTVLTSLPPNIHLRIIPFSPNRHDACLAYYSSIAHKFLSVTVYASSDNIINVFPSHTFIQPRATLLPYTVLGPSTPQAPVDSAAASDHPQHLLPVPSDRRAPFLTKDDLDATDLDLDDPQDESLENHLVEIGQY